MDVGNDFKVLEGVIHFWNLILLLSSSSMVSSNCSLGKDGEAKRLANAIMPAFGSPSVLRSGDGALAALPIALVIMVLVLLVEAGEEKIELPSVNARLFR